MIRLYPPERLVDGLLVRAAELAGLLWYVGRETVAVVRAAWRAR